LNQDPIPKLTKGKLTEELEKKWSKKIGSKYSVFVNSGSSSILLTLATLVHTNRLKNNKIVIPGLSWSTDLSSPILLNMDPILCDCNLTDLSCDLNHLEEIFRLEKPSCFILVSALGLVPNMDEIIHLCQKYDVILLEDVCESMGSKYRGKYLGTFGFASFFSMYFGHHLSTIEGGFINTDDEDFYHSLLMMRSHGWDRDLPEQKQKKLRLKYEVDDFESLYNFYLPGFNLRSTDLQAFIGLRSIDKLDDFSIKRNKNFLLYESLILENEIKITINNEDFISNFAFPILREKRSSLIFHLKKNKIEVRPLIAGDISQKPIWTERNKRIELPNCSQVNSKGFYLPNHQDLTTDDIVFICEILNKY
jgi:CDP-6-deoxy-D-xylo-4-hexulose-3-dehydrase